MDSQSQSRSPRDLPCKKRNLCFSGVKVILFGIAAVAVFFLGCSSGFVTTKKYRRLLLFRIYCPRGWGRYQRPFTAMLSPLNQSQDNGFFALTLFTWQLRLSYYLYLPLPSLRLRSNVVETEASLLPVWICSVTRGSRQAIQKCWLLSLFHISLITSLFRNRVFPVTRPLKDLVRAENFCLTLLTV